jgi:two-component system, NarL family, sensor histidine kinase DesK
VAALVGDDPALTVAGTPAAAREPVQEWPAAPLPDGERVQVLIFSGVWLVFLAIPVFSILSGTAAPALKVLGMAALAVFVVVYLVSFLHPWPVRALPLWANTLIFTVALVLCAAASLPAAGLTAWNCLPFVLAVWVFPHEMRTGIPAALVITALGTASALWFAGPEDSFWLIAPLALTLVIIVTMRFAQERETRTQALQQALALSRQREQVGRDVHDVLGHSLTVITLKTELARKLVDADPEQAKAELDEVLGLSRRSLAEVRHAVGGLHTPDLGAQLAAARTAFSAAGIPARLPDAASVSGLPADHRDLFAWCLREAVTNVIRHSGAAHCAVTVTAGRLTVADDGVGLGVPSHRRDGAGGPAPDPAPAASPGQGLRGMRHRVTEAGGTLSLRQTYPGRDRPGTTLEVRL